MSSPSKLRRGLAAWLACGWFAMILFTGRRACGDVVHDGSLSGGLRIPLTGPNYEILEAQGLRPGGGANLFHSFERFNLTSSESATFHSSAGIQNILARITGGTASSIDGKIISKDTDANLYLLNPAGMMFGPNATLDLNGSFYASSASYLRLKDGTKFNAVPGPDDLLLSSAPPEAFGFLGPGAGSITVDGSQLSVTPGKNLGLVGGVVTVRNGAKLTAADGAVQIVAVGSAGEVKLDGMGGSPGYSSTAAVMADVTLDNATLDASGPKGGAVFIRGGKIMVTNNSQVAASTTGSGPGRGIDIEGQGDVLINGLSNLYVGNAGPGQPGSIHIGGANVYVGDGLGGAGYVKTGNEAAGGIAGDLQMSVQGLLQITGGGIVSTNTSGPGLGGNLTIHAGSLKIEGPATSGPETGILARVEEGAVGDARLLSVTVDQMLSITGNGVISTSTFGPGRGGELTVRAGSVSIDSGTSGFSPGIYARANSSGDAGGLSVTVDQLLSIKGGGEIATGTSGPGRGGNLTLHAGSLSIEGSATPGVFTGLAATADKTSTGDAGALSVMVDQLLSIKSGGEISTTTFGVGRGGDLTVHSGSLSIEGSATPGVFTGIAAVAGEGSTGNTGVLSVKVDQLLSIQSAGEISCSTYGSGNGGNLTIHAGSLSIDGSALPAQFTGIAAQAGTGLTGNAGALSVTVDGKMYIAGGGEVSTTTFGSGFGGDITIHAGSLSIDGVASGFLTGIFARAAAGSTGNAGALSMTVDQMLAIRAGGEISTNTSGLGVGGNLTIHAGNLSIDGAASGFITGISSEAGTGLTGNAGALSVTVDQLLSISSGGRISSDTSGLGSGGNLTIHAGNLSIDGAASGFFTGISSEAGTGLTGNAGTLSVTVDQLLSINSGGRISSDTSGLGSGGILTVRAGNLSIDGEASDFFTGISTDAITGSKGNAGSLSVTVDRLLSITGGGLITADTSGEGRGGNLTVHSGNLSIDGTIYDGFTGISADALEGSTGRSGNVLVTVAGALTLVGGASISTSAYSSGRGGDLVVTAPMISILGGSAIYADTNAVADDAGHAGNINLSTLHLLIDGADMPTSFTGVSSESYGTGRAGNVTVHTGTLSLLNTGEISASAYDVGAGGTVNVYADSALIRDRINGDSSGIFAASFGSGNAGDVIYHGNSLTMLAGGLISSSTTGIGNAGAVTVTAGQIYIDGQGAPVSTGIFSNARPGSSGDAGNVSVVANGLTLAGGAEVAAVTYATGNGGNVALRAQNLVINGNGTNFFTGLRATAERGSTGNAGDVSVDASRAILMGSGQISARTLGSGNAGDVVFHGGVLSLQGGGLLSSSTRGSGNAGSVTVNAGQILIDGQGVPVSTGIFSNASAGSSGNAGNVSVVTNSLTITRGGEVATATNGPGNGGSVALHTNNLFVDGGGTRFFTGLRAAALPGSTGSAGNVEVTANRATLVGDGQISAQTNGPGNAGDVNLNISGQLNLSSGSEVTASTSGSGDAGTVSITAKDLIMSTGAQIGSLSSGSGNAGGLFINLKNDLHMNSNSLITVESLRTSAGDAFIKAGGSILLNDSAIRTSAAQNGGSVLLSAQDFIRLDGSRITAEAQGNGGNIFLRDARFALFNDSVLTANAVKGSGGLIQIGTQVLLTNNSFITASSQFGADGEVRIDALYDLSGTTRALEDKVLDASDQLQPRCHAKIPGESGSFILMGKGGLPVMPGRYLPAHLLMELPEE